MFYGVCMLGTSWDQHIPWSPDGTTRSDWIRILRATACMHHSWHIRPGEHLTAADTCSKVIRGESPLVLVWNPDPLQPFASTSPRAPFQHSVSSLLNAVLPVSFISPVEAKARNGQAGCAYAGASQGACMQSCCTYRAGPLGFLYMADRPLR